MKKLLTLGIGILVAGAVLTVTPVPKAAAATPPDSCFQFAAGTITYYYDNEGNNGANPACPRNVDIPSTIGGVPVTVIGNYAMSSMNLTAVTLPAGLTTINQRAFSDNMLTNVTIPSTVTIIGNLAFINNKLTSLTIPDAVTDINNAFGANQLETVTLGKGITALEDSAFALNRLKSVVIPSNVTSIDRSAFMMQNTYGGIIDGYDNPAVSLWQNAASAQAAYDGMWYAQLYTEDPSNPSNFQDGYINEAYYSGYDANGNGTQNDSFGGHLINPAGTALHYVDKDGNVLQSPVSYVGKTADDRLLDDYMAKTGPAVPAPADPYAPTPAETTAIRAALAAYWSLGASVSFTAPAIAGYTTPDPSTQTFSLTSIMTDHNFVYASPTTDTGTGTGNDDTLADTGSNMPLIVTVLSLITGLGVFVLARSLKQNML